MVGFWVSAQAVLVVREQPIGGGGCDRKCIRMMRYGMSMIILFAD
jgi:hypothetical protein